MRRYLLPLVIGLIVVGILAALFGPSALRSMPTRYAMRLPEPLQAMALPADPTPILPTAIAPVEAAGLLLSDEQRREVNATAMPPASLTPLPVAAEYAQSDAVVDSLPSPSPTPPPPATATPWPVPAAVRLTGFRHKFQEWNNCGPATLAMALSYFGLNVGQSDTAAVLRPNPEDRNVSPDEMAAYVNEQTDLQAIARANGSRNLLQRLIAADVPVIIEIGIEPPGEYRWLGWYGHYLLPVAYDEALQQFWVYDSWFGTSEEPLKNAHPDGRALTYEQLEQYWPQFNRNYIALYRPEQAATVAEIIGEDMDETAMWEHNLTQVQADAAADPANPFSWFNLGTVYAALGEYDKATTAYDQARAIGLPWRMLWYQFGPYEAYYQTGRYDDVILLADTTMQDRPYFEEAYYYKALAQAALGDQAGARENLTRAAEFNPNFLPAVEALAQLDGASRTAPATTP